MNENLRLIIENKKLRQMLAFYYVGMNTLHEDQELLDCSVYPFIDFKRDELDEIQRKMQQRVFDKTKIVKE
jgi:hypothetical protein